MEVLQTSPLGHLGTAPQKISIAKVASGEWRVASGEQEREQSDLTAGESASLEPASSSGRRPKSQELAVTLRTPIFVSRVSGFVFRSSTGSSLCHQSYFFAATRGEAILASRRKRADSSGGVGLM